MQDIRGICRLDLSIPLLLLSFGSHSPTRSLRLPFLFRICSIGAASLSLSLSILSFSLSFFASPFVLQTGQPKEASNVALSSLSIRADSVELPSSKVRASNEAINKSTALTGLSTLFVRDDVSILEFFSCLRVRNVGPDLALLSSQDPSSPHPSDVPLARLSSIKPSLPPEDFGFFHLVASPAMFLP